MTWIGSGLAGRRRKEAAVIERKASLAPEPEELWALALLVASYLAAEALFGNASFATVNAVGPLILSAILGYGAWRMIATDGTNIWTSLFWFRLSTAAYFGLGTYAIFAVNATTRAYMETYFRFYDGAVFKLNVIVAASALVVLATSRFAIAATAPANRRRHVSSASAKTKRDMAGLLSVGLAFLLVGLGVQYVFVVPYQLRWTEDVLPGSVMSLANLLPVGIFMTTAASLVRGRSLLPLMVAVVALCAVTSLLLFEKSTLLTSLILFLLAFLWHRLTLRRVLVAAGVVIATYVAIIPIVDYGRTEMQQRFGIQPVASLDDRWEILTAYFRQGPIEQPGEQIQGAWNRISYVNQATFAIHLYDSGLAGDSLSLLPAVLVPRFLWPNKPIITQIGTDFNVMATGNDQSASSPGVFAEAYWNFGWAGIPMCMIPFGFILAHLSLYTARIFRDGRWIYFPTVFLALRIGFRTDGHIVADIAGALVILIATHLLLFAAERLGTQVLYSRGPA